MRGGGVAELGDGNGVFGISSSSFFSLARALLFHRVTCEPEVGDTKRLHKVLVRVRDLYISGQFVLWQGCQTDDSKDNDGVR